MGGVSGVKYRSTGFPLVRENRKIKEDLQEKYIAIGRGKGRGFGENLISIGRV